MENMAKGCGRSDEIEGVNRMPRIVIPTVESKVDSLTSTSYSSTVYSATYTLNAGVSGSSLSKACVKRFQLVIVTVETSLINSGNH